jgi:hypothetical protein
MASALESAVVISLAATVVVTAPLAIPVLPAAAPLLPPEVQVGMSVLLLLLLLLLLLCFRLGLSAQTMNLQSSWLITSSLANIDFESRCGTTGIVRIAAPAPCGMADVVSSADSSQVDTSEETELVSPTSGTALLLLLPRPSDPSAVTVSSLASASCSSSSSALVGAALAEPYRHLTERRSNGGDFEVNPLSDCRHVIVAIAASDGVDPNAVEGVVADTRSVVTDDSDGRNVGVEFATAVVHAAAEVWQRSQAAAERDGGKSSVKNVSVTWLRKLSISGVDGGDTDDCGNAPAGTISAFLPLPLPLPLISPRAMFDVRVRGVVDSRFRPCRP